MNSKVGRNDNCPCGSGKKYKKCCLEKASVVDLSWRKLRKLEGEIVGEILFPYVTKLFPVDILKEVVDNFIPEKLPEEIDPAMVFENFFMPWFLFNWLPPADLGIEGIIVNQPIALQYSNNFSQNLSSEQKEFIETMCKTYYSFYVVLEVEPEQAVVVKDILLDDQYRVKERTGTHFLNRGDIVFSRILTLSDQSIFIGMAPLVVPTRYHLDIIALRNDFIDDINGEKLTGKLLRDEFEWDLIDYFFSIMENAFNKELPKLQNTDGDPIQPCKSYFKLEISVEEALEKLLPLTLSGDAGEFLSEAKRDRSGAIMSIQFPWLKKGNKKHKEWENTLMGQITIKGDRLTLETNSEKRCKKGQELLKKHLNNQVFFQKTVMESIESALQNSPMMAKGKKSQQELCNLPEVQEQLKEMKQKHWRHWFDDPVPALGHKTPRQAAKTKKGRELLEALLLQYEVHDRNHSNNLLKADIPYIKAELGLEG